MIQDRDEKGIYLTMVDDIMKVPMPKITPPRTDLGAEIRRLRDDVLRFSQQELGDILHVKGNVISRWETGVNVPTVQSLAQIARLSAKSPAEERDIFHRLVEMAGNPQPWNSAAMKASVPEKAAAESDGDRELGPAATVEGQMARVIVDYIRDPALRLHLVLSLRDMAQQAQAGAAETPQAPRP